LVYFVIDVMIGTFIWNLQIR